MRRGYAPVTAVYERMSTDCPPPRGPSARCKATAPGASLIPLRLLAAALLFCLLPGGAAAQDLTVTGAGSTFAYPLYSRWASVYLQSHPGIQVNYQSIGSGGGIRQVSIGTVEFGGTDGPMTDAQLAEARSKIGADILHFPTAVGAAVPVYNIPGVHTDLNFTPAALAGIFLGTIQRWNDPEIVRANPGVTLPE